MLLFLILLTIAEIETLVGKRSLVIQWMMKAMTSSTVRPNSEKITRNMYYHQHTLSS